MTWPSYFRLFEKQTISRQCQLYGITSLHREFVSFIFTLLQSIHVPVPNAKRDLFINREARPGKTHVTRRMILWDVLSFAHSSLYKFFGSSQVNIDVYIFVMRLTVPARRWVAWLTLATTWILIHILWRKKRIRWKYLYYTYEAYISVFLSRALIALFNVAYYS